MAEEQSLLKYRVMIVDDEPMAVKAIERIIERNCPAFTVVGTAGNGREALDMLSVAKPDLVLTDIAMPLMSGLELAKAARETDPEVSFVVISGYQDFQYMRDAIQTGVLDYLAKPIVPSVIVSMMERVRLKLQASFYERRNKVLRELCHGAKVPQSEMDRLFPMESYCAALLRENGLPRRFSSSSGTEIFGNPEENFSVYGRDSMEELHLIPEVLLAEQPVEEYMNRLKERRAGKDSYTTLILYGKPFGRELIPEKIRGLYDALNMRSIVGCSQTVDLDRPDFEHGPLPNISSGENDRLLAELELLADQKRTDLVYDRIIKAMDKWAENRRTQLWMEQASRRILHFLRMQSKEEAGILESEYRLEDAFYYATSFPMLKENLKGIFFPSEAEEKEPPKVDSPAFFGNVELYLSRHLSEALSLQNLSDHFAISQAYMSKLFRKYAGKSYAQYLTDIRMDRAKELMRANPKMYVKDIAPLVGYQDQFYFSRIFRSTTGMSPAEFLKAESSGADIMS